MSDTQLPSDELVKQFLALPSHEEKCRFFNDAANVALHAIFRPIHFPKLADAAKPSEPTV